MRFRQSARLAPALEPTNLLEARPGEGVRVVGFAALSAGQRERLQSYGVSVGRVISVIQQRPVTVVAIEHAELALEHELASQVRVERARSDPGHHAATHRSRTPRGRGGWGGTYRHPIQPDARHVTRTRKARGWLLDVIVALMAVLLFGTAQLRLSPTAETVIMALITALAIGLMAWWCRVEQRAAD